MRYYLRNLLVLIAASATSLLVGTTPASAQVHHEGRVIHNGHVDRVDHVHHNGHVDRIITHEPTNNGRIHHEGTVIHNGHVDRIDHVHHNGHVDRIITHDNSGVSRNSGPSYASPSYPSGTIIGADGVRYERVWNGTGWDRIPVSASTVVQPTPVVVSTPSSLALKSSGPLETVTSKKNVMPYKGPGVTIALPQDSGGEVVYFIDGNEEAVIRAGEEQKLSKKGTYEVKFHRGMSDEGKDMGHARYTIKEGNYEFEVTEKGWDLMRISAVTSGPAKASPSGLTTNVLPSRKGNKTGDESAAMPPVAE